ncbi:MAG: response regulator [Planctomycetales bacterium]|nr:response regulator [Planctomycetales bacterium]
MATADHGLECLEVLHRFAPDVIVVEPELLWGGGDGVLAVISDRPAMRHVPVLVLTSDCDRAAMYSISQFQISDFLRQPVSPKRLTGRVVRLAFGDQLPLTAESRLGNAIGAPPPKRELSLCVEQMH